MRRIRIVFALLAVALFVPLALLVQRALLSVAVEREARHRAVADRVFDELERELGRTARAEEERPVAHYRFYVVPEDLAAGNHALARSPLSGPPEPDFVVGFFEIDADGSFHSPRVPRERSRAQAKGDFRPSEDLSEDVARLEEIVRRGLEAPEPMVAEVVSRDVSQAPGTTRKLARAKKSAKGKADAIAMAPAEPEAESKEEAQLDAYSALRSLNRAADERRLAKSAPRKDVYAARAEGERVRSLAPEVVFPRPFEEGPALQRARPSGRLAEREARPQVLASELGVFADADDAVAGLGAAAADVPAPSLEPAPVVEPLSGRVVDDAYVILHRFVSIGGRSATTQGLVVDVAALGRWLQDAVLGGTELARLASLAFFPAGDPPPTALAEFDYVHRFAEPFEGLSAQLSLAPLPTAGGTRYLQAMAFLLVLAGSVGLVALYRMVAVRVRFAERRSNFVASVTHELKTPLTAVRMYGEMLRDGMVDSEEKRREYAATITAESERLTRLIDNVLEFSRLEQGTREMNLAAGDVGPVVEEAARILAPHAREVGFDLRVAVEPGLPPVRFDRDAVLQVVFNLVDNALKYARDAGDRVIELRCGREGGAVVVSVRDRGPGVSQRHLARIFEPFYRGENELTRRAKGTGIGLALVKGLAERMGAGVVPRTPAEGGFEVALSFRPAA